MKGKQNSRRLLALILSIIVVLCMMPSIAIAETFNDASDQNTQAAKGEALSLPQAEGGEDAELKNEPETQPEGEGLQSDLNKDEGSQIDLPDLTKEDGSQSNLPDLTKNEEPQVDPLRENPEVPSEAGSPGNNQEPEGKSAGLDNPDHLSKPDDSSYAGKINYSSYPETPFLSAPNSLSRSSKSGTRANNPPIIGTDHPTQPGEVMLFKEAKPVAGMVNTWDITLRIEGKDKPVTSDIILVIDTSGSMSGTRLAAAKSAANSFIDALLPSTTTRIGIVNFDYYAHDTHALSNNVTTLKSAINGLNANGGTFTQAGVKQAEAMLANSTADHKHIVLLSDGEPTYSYKLSNPDNYLIPYDTRHRETGTHAPSSAYLYGDNNRVGDGSNLREYYGRDWIGGWGGYYSNKYYNNGNSAIAEAGFAKNSGYRVWTIALEAGTTGTGILNSMASPSSSYTATPAELQTIFANIAGQIGAAVKNAQVADPMGGGFEVVFGEIFNIYVSQGTYTYNQTQTPKTINWNPGTLTTPLPDDATIKYAELKYTVVVNDDILGQTPEGDLYSTNGNAQVTYTDVDGNTQTGAFPIPKVDPILLVVEKVLYDSHGNKVTTDTLDRVFTIEITGNLAGVGSLPAYHQIFNLRLGEKRIMTNLRLEDTYTVAETQVKYGGDFGTVGSLEDYTTTVNVYDIDQTSFEIRQGDPDSPVLVTNRELPKGKITVYKVFQPVTQGKSGRRQSPPTFTFTLTKPGGATEEFTLQAGQNKEFNKLPYGEYIVEETNSQGFVATYSDTDATNGTLTDGKVTLTILEKDDSVTVTNAPNPDDQFVPVVGKKIWSGGPVADHVAVVMCLKRNGELMNPQPTYTVSPASGTASIFTYTWTNLQKYDDSGVPYEYTIDEPTIPAKYISVLSEDGLTVTNTYTPEIESKIQAKKIWKDGPTPRPTIYFDLFRKIAGGAEEKVTGAATQTLPNGTSTVEWVNLPKEDNDGNLYTYYVKEKTTINGTTYGPPANYELSSGEGTLILTNKYKSPTAPVKATKIWIDGPSTHPDVWFKLYRKIAGGLVEEVPEAGIKHLPNGTTEVTWPNVDQTDKDGKTYIFSVREFIWDATTQEYVEGAPENYVRSGGEGTATPLTVTNTYNSPAIDPITAKKVWVDGSDNVPAIGLRLHRYLKGGSPNTNPAADAVSGATTVLINNKTDVTATWTHFPATDENGVAYVYYVREVRQQGNYQPGITPTLVYGAPTNYTVDNNNYADANTGVDPVTGEWTITNRYQIPTDGEAKATKVWKNGPTPRPTVWFQLFRNIAGGTPVAVLDSNGDPLIKELANGTTSVEWTGLEKTDINGNVYIFSVKEVDAAGNDFTPANYIKSGEGTLSIQNLYTPPTQNITATKTWAGNFPTDPTYKHPTVTFQLQYKTENAESWNVYPVLGELNGTAETPPEGSSGELAEWVFTWKNVPMNDLNGNPYVFRVVESPVPDNHTVEYSGNVTNGFVVTNTYQTVNVSGEKTWDDADNQDGLRPTSITINLYKKVGTADPVFVKSQEVTPNVNGVWTWTFANLAKYEGGKEIVYTITEDTVEGYSSKVDGYNVTNSYTPETVDISGSKTWSDSNDQDGVRPDSITIRLLADGTEVDQKAVTLADGWAWEFTGLAKYRDGGVEIVYTITEDTVEGYSSKVDGYNVTNSYTPATVDISGSKTWSDSNDQDGVRPDSITIRLLADGTEVDQKAVTLADGWAWEFTGLAKYRDGGVEIVYTITEDTVEGYSSKVDGYNVTNSYTPATVDISGSKTWSDSNDQDGVRPDSITIRLLADGTEVDQKAVTLADGWAWEFTGLAKYRDGGVEIVYTITEDTVEGYSSKVDGYNVTNSYTPETVDISGSKTWSDSNDQDGVRPDSITIRLLADGTEVDQKAVTLADGWAWEFTGLAKYRDGGVEIVYTITEDTVEGYSSKVDGYNVTNSYTPETVDISGSKTWSDSNDQDGVRPDSITIRLLADGTEVDQKAVTLADGWAWEFTGLAKYRDGGVEIVYTITEDTVEGYSSKVDGYNVTNSYTPATVDISGSKTWSDSNDQDGVRPDSITIRLLADGTEVDQKAVTLADGWAWEFTGLAKYRDGGVEIVYTITEDTVEGYSSKVDGYNVTNSYTPATVDISGSKTWSDSNDQDGVRPDSITIRLLADGTEVDQKAVTLADGWAWEFTGLAKYRDGGVEIVYTITEDTVEGYSSKVDGYNVTNSYTPETVDISGSKTWSDSNDQDGVRPDSITIRLLADGTEVDQKAVTLADGWAWEFTGLAKYRDGGVEIVYTITEDTVEGYSSKVDGYNVTNTHTPGKTSVQVTKAWVDKNNQDGMRPEFVTVKLLADDVDTGKTVTLSAENNWTDTFTELDIFKPGEVGQRVVYTVEEVGVDGYDEPEITGDAETGYIVTNCHTPETVDVSGSKTWDDANNQDGKRPASITINLLKKVGEGEVSLVDSKIVKADAEGNWVWTFANLPKYEDGVEIVYSISEEAVNGYTSEVSGYNVTNRYAPAKISFPVTKVWAVINGPTNGHPDSITIKLIADGQDTGKTLVLTNDNDWTDTFIELDRFKDGKEIVYTIDEILVENYECIITGDAENGFVVLNTQIKSTNITPDNVLPKTGERGGTPWMSFALLSLAGVLLVLRKKRSIVLKEKS